MKDDSSLEFRMAVDGGAPRVHREARRLGYLTMGGRLTLERAHGVVAVQRAQDLESQYNELCPEAMLDH